MPNTYEEIRTSTPHAVNWDDLGDIYDTARIKTTHDTTCTYCGPAVPHPGIYPKGTLRVAQRSTQKDTQRSKAQSAKNLKTAPKSNFNA